MNSGLHTVQFIGFGCAQFTNLILLFLIHKKAKSLFGSYRHVMFVFTAYSLVYTWIEIFTLPIMHIRGSLFLMIVDSFLRYEQEIGYYVMSLYCASYALCIFLLATQFYYRYIVVCKPENLVKINGWKLGLIFLPGIFFFFIWFSLVFFVMKKTEENMEMAKEVIMETYQEDTSKVAYVALQFWDVDSNGVKHPRIWDWLSYIGCCSMIGICCSTIMFCAAKSYLKLKCSLNVMSTKTRELNKQLLLTLAFQTATPFFMMYITVGTILTLPIFEIEVGRKGNLVGSLAGVYPAIEPLIAMYFVKDFRKALSCQAKVEISSAIVQIKNDLQEDRRKSTQGSTVYINKSLI